MKGLLLVGEWYEGLALKDLTVESYHSTCQFGATGRHSEKCECFLLSSSINGSHVVSVI